MRQVGEERRVRTQAGLVCLTLEVGGGGCGGLELDICIFSSGGGMVVVEFLSAGWRREGGTPGSERRSGGYAGRREIAARVGVVPGRRRRRWIT